MRLEIFSVALLLTLSQEARGESRGEVALKSLFPEAQSFVPRDVLLTDEVASRLERLARARIPERMVTFYVAKRAEAVVGYGVVHTRKVRTKNETLAVAFERDGRLRRVAVVQFFEPEEYRPPLGWLSLLEGKTAADRLVVGDDLPVVTGATLSVRSVAEVSRWLLQALQLTQLQSEAGAP